MSATTPSLKTRTVAGQKLTLIAGVRYVASREWCSSLNRRQREWPVTIQAAIGSPPEIENVVVPGLDFDAATKLVNAFNNGRMSFDGRVW